jgi:hypothetical protein
MATGQASATPIVNVLEDSTKDFVALGIRVGEVVYNTTSNLCALVTQDPSSSNPSQLLIDSDIFTLGSESYAVYQNSPLSGEPNAGCVLYVGFGGDVFVTTAGGDNVLFAGVPTGSFIPVNVVKVWQSATTADFIVALW